jgi:hypothetical protein
MALSGLKLSVAVVAGTLALGVVPITPQQDVASAVSRASVTDTAGDRTQEARYLARIVELLDEGIANRVNLHLALRTRRSAEEYHQLLDEFRMRQLGFLLRLQDLQTPPRLIGFHESLRSAIVTQSAFYTAFVRAKVRDRNVGLDAMVGHPALHASGVDFQTAWEHVRRLHPALDGRTEAAIEGQLCWLDVI